MKTVITYGTFDCFHFGHLSLLRRAREMGDRLIVGVSTDEFNEKEKNKKTLFPYKERAAIVSALRCVDQVIPEESWNQKAKDIGELEVDIFVIGDDWQGHFDDELGSLCSVRYLARTAGVSATQIKRLLYEQYPSSHEGG